MVKTSGNQGISEESSLNDWWKKNLMTQVASHDNNLTKTKKPQQNINLLYLTFNFY